MQLRELISHLESVAPPVYQESYDNAGLITGSPEMDVRGVLVCLDSTEAVIAEAVKKNCNVVVAHHPIIFKGLKQLTGRTYVERVVIEAIRANIAIYAIHTNLDNVLHQGVNGKIAERLGLLRTRILAPKSDLLQLSEVEDHAATVGSGLIGELPAPLPETEFLTFLKEKMRTDCIRHTALLGRSIQRVALCGGAGAFLLDKALSRHADIFITADYKYHEFFDADGQIIIADIGHYESEQFTIELLSEIISGKFRNFAVHCTDVRTNPVHYFTN